MKIIFPRLLRAWFRAAIVLAVINFSAPAQAELTMAEALDAPGLTWTHTGTGQWLAKPGSGGHDGTDYAEVAEYYDKAGEAVTATLTTQIQGPAVVRFWWRYVSAFTDPALDLAVDGAFIRLPYWPTDPDGYWTQSEVQLCAGPHTLSFRPFLGTAVRLDEVIVTPGTGDLLQAAGDAPVSWLIAAPGLWAATTDAPQGLSGAITWAGPGNYAQIFCVLPPDIKLEAWVKETQTGCDIGGDRSQYFYRAPWPDWQRLRMRPFSRWVGITTYVDAPNVVPNLKVAGITISPAGIGDVLDASELPWTAVGSRPFALDGFEFITNGSCSFKVEDNHPFDSGFTTSLTGPGKLYFGVTGGGHEGTYWRATLNGVPTTGLFTTQWDRPSVMVPPGPVTAEISAVSEAPFSYATLDQVTWCTAANARQLDALDLPASAKMWIRESASGMWNRTASTSHDGGDALALVPSPAPRRADLFLPADGSRLAGMWIKGTPRTDLLVSRVGPAYFEYKVIRPGVAGGGGWRWIPFVTGPDTAELGFAVPADSDEGDALYLDSYRLYNTSVPLAEALDNPDKIWMGTGGIALPGSDASGEDAVLLLSQGAGTNPIEVDSGGPFRLKFRYLFCGLTYYHRLRWEVLPGVDVSDFYSPGYYPPRHHAHAWQQGEIIRYDASANTRLRVHCTDGAALLDSVEILPLTETTFAEALDAPGITPVTPGGWRGISGVGHDGHDALVSPPLNGFIAWPAEPVVYEMAVSNPAAGQGMDGGFWWKNEDGSGLGDLAFQTSSTSGRFLYTGTGWQRVRVHCDRAPVQLGWSQRVRPPLWQYPVTLPTGTAMVDELSLVPAAPDSFSRALDTDGPGPGIAASGWNAIGDATARVQTDVTWQDGDALEIRAVPGGAAMQSLHLMGVITAGADFSCRVRRGPLPDCTLKLMLDDEFFGEVPLTTEWTEFRVLLPTAYGYGQNNITLLATVPDGGPDAVIHLDAVSLTQATDLNAALETTGLTWTGSGQGRQVIGGERLPDYDFRPPYTGLFDGVSVMDLTNGQRRWLDTVMVGPGVVVLTGFRPPNTEGDWRTSLVVDGLTRDDLPSIDYGPFQLQAVLPDGAHTIRWLVERDAESAPGAGTIQLHSAALVPGLAPDLLSAALETIAPGRAWAPGGTHPPVPRYSLREGVTAVDGIFLPSWAFGESSWIETAITGPARVNFTWQSAALAACYMDGRTACRTLAKPGHGLLTDPVTTLHLPSGPHTLRWAASQGGTAELRAFAVTPGSDVAGVLAGTDPFIAWLHDPVPPWLGSWQAPWMGAWQAVTDGPLFNFDTVGLPIEVPGTGLPVLGAGDLSVGSFWVTGPVVVSFDVRSETFVPLKVGVDEEYYFLAPGTSDGFYDMRWHPHAVVVPTGQHLVSLAIQEDDGGPDPYVRLKNLRSEPGLPWLTWAYGLGLLGLRESGPYADPDNDGVSNLMEFAFGTQPRTSNLLNAPGLTGGPENPVLQFPSLPWDATSLTYDIETSPDLASWTSFTTLHPHPPNQAGPSVPLPAPAPTGRTFYRISVRL